MEENKINIDTLKAFQNYRNKIDDIQEKLYIKAREVWKWEEENLGKKFENSSYYLNTEKADCVEIYRPNVYNPIEIDDNYEMEDMDYVCFELYDTWAYGGYDEKTMSIPLYKLLSDDWRDEALKKYNVKLELERKEKEKAEQERIREKEEKDRADYERLKAKFES